MTRHLSSAVPADHFKDRPKLPKGWRWDNLGKALRQAKRFVTINDSEIYRRVTVQLHGRGITPRDEVPGSVIKTKKQQLIAPDDLLVAEIDAKVGGFGIVPQELKNAIVSTHYFTFIINSELLLPQFLQAFIRTGYLTREVLAFVRGSLNYAAIRPRHIMEMPFPFADIPHQQQLIARLALVEQAQTALDAQRAALESLPSVIVRATLEGNRS